MKLLFDQNLSPRLVQRLQALCPDSSHVSLVGLERALDVEVWQFARDHDYILVTKDADFSELSVLYGAPPKVLWLRIGNCTTAQIETLLLARYDAIASFVQDETTAILTIF